MTAFMPAQEAPAANAVLGRAMQAVSIRFAQRRRQGRGILTHLALVSALVFIPSILVVGYLLLNSAYADKAMLNATGLAKSREVAGLIEREFHGLLGAEMVLSASPELLRGDFATFYNTAKSLTQHYGHNVFLARRDGTQFFNSHETYGATLPRFGDLAFIEHVLGTGAPTISTVHRGTNAAVPVVSVAMPVSCGLPEPCVLGVSIETARFQKLALEAVKDPRCIVAITDQNDAFVARTRDYENTVGKKAPSTLSASIRGRQSGAVTIRNFEGVKVDNNFTRLRLTDWVATVSVPQAALHEPFWRNLRQLLAVTAIWLLLTTLAALYFGGRIRAAISGLAIAAPGVAKGLSDRIAPTPVKEVNEVGRALLDAAESIREHRAALEASNEQTKFLMRECMHRAKNQLAIIESMVRQSMRRAETMEQFAESIRERMHGLSRTQNLLLEEEWHGVPVVQLIQLHLEHFLPEFEDRIRLKGPPLVIKPEAAQNLGMVFHELASNAAKYGALSVPQGRIDVLWQVQGEKFAMIWRESGGPPVKPPTRKGFGAQVITRIAASTIDGQVDLDYAPSGFQWKVAGTTAYFVEKK